MKRAHKKRGKGRPKKAEKMKAIIRAISLTPAQDRQLDAIMKATGLDRSKAVQMLIERHEG
jgi:predicted transcriptional regulator